MQIHNAKFSKYEGWPYRFYRQLLSFFYYIFCVDESLVVFKLQETKLMRKCKVSQYYVEMLILKVSNSEGEKGFIKKT